MEINAAGPGASESEILIDRPFHGLHPAEKVFRLMADRRNIFQNLQITLRAVLAKNNKLAVIIVIALNKCAYIDICKNIV